MRTSSTAADSPDTHMTHENERKFEDDQPKPFEIEKERKRLPLGLAN